MKNDTKIVFVVLVFKNTQDLIDLFESIKKNVKEDYRVIVVDNFYSEDTSKVLKQICLLNNATYICSENKGYSYGNNVGIKYANEYFSYKFLIVSNPDIIIEDFSVDFDQLDTSTIYAPIIIDRKGRNQNPHLYIDNHLADWLMYLGFRFNLNLFVYFGIIINKLIKVCLNRFRSNSKNIIHACHGSFILIGADIFKKISTLFDDRYFLYCEESDLAKQAKKEKITIKLIDHIKVLHKEDGSISLTNFRLFDLQKESYLKYYNKWYRRNE